MTTVPIEGYRSPSLRLKAPVLALGLILSRLAALALSGVDLQVGNHGTTGNS